jgi:pyruvate/2-oxoglutarate/acetoin dehydrogenase E1 component
MAETKYWKALNDSLRLEMRRDERVLVLGEDVAGAGGREEQGLVDAWGGPWGTSRGLIQEFGPERVRDTPISESGFVGLAIGVAAEGYRPWVELQFTDLMPVAWDQLTNRMARTHYLTAGQATLPITIKTNGECYGPLVHYPGLMCIAPSDAYTAKGLMIAAIREDNPVIFFDNLRNLRQATEVPEEAYTLPIGQARVVREGTDVTLLGIGFTTTVCRNAAELLAEEGVDAEVVDLLTLAPWDIPGVVASVKKTKRLVVVDFDHPACGLASEIAATVAARLWDTLENAPLRVTPPSVPGMLTDGNQVMTELYYPNEERVRGAALELLGKVSATA